MEIISSNWMGTGKSHSFEINNKTGIKPGISKKMLTKKCWQYFQFDKIQKTKGISANCVSISDNKLNKISLNPIERTSSVHFKGVSFAHRYQLTCFLMNKSWHLVYFCSNIIALYIFFVALLNASERRCGKGHFSTSAQSFLSCKSPRSLQHEKKIGHSIAATEESRCQGKQ